jgi:acetyl esterase/lipase
MTPLPGSSCAADLGPPPPFDPELAGPLESILAERPPLVPELIDSRRRESRATALDDAAITRDGEYNLDVVHVAGPPGGGPIELLVCRPTTTSAPHPTIVHIHGGGMVAGSPRSVELAHDLDRAAELGMAVVAVDYRLAPEHPDPAPVEDCYAALIGVRELSVQLGFDPHRIVLSGNSAGGGLAAGVGLLARDRGGPAVAGLLLQCPMLDDRAASPSTIQMHGVGLWDPLSNRTGWDALLGERRGGDDVAPYAAPARAVNLSGLPPTFIDVGSVEALRDEAVGWSARMLLAGGDAELHVWSGAFHSFDQWVPSAVVSQTAERCRRDWLRRLMAR